MLTLVTMFTGLKSDIPPVAYVKVCQDIQILVNVNQSKNVALCFFVLLGFRSLDGRMYVLRVRRTRRIRRCQSFRCPLPV